MIRIVKLTFKKDQISSFKEFIATKKDKIASFEGCQSLEILQDMDNPQIFFTYSHWESPENLENYRKSELFNEIWDTVKVWFDSKAEAWSVEALF